MSSIVVILQKGRKNNYYNILENAFKMVAGHNNSFLSTSIEKVKSVDAIPGPKGLPLLGTLLEYKYKGPYRISNYNEALVNRYKTYGDIYRENIGGECIIHLCNPDFFRIVLESEGKMPYIPPLQATVQKYRREKNMSLGLGNTNGEVWYRLRSAVQQMMMRPKSAQQFLPLSDKVAARFMTCIHSKRDPQTGEVPDFERELKRWIVESAGMICFEEWLGFLSNNTQLADQLIDANNLIFQLSAELKFSLPFYKLINTPKWKRLVNAEDFFVGRSLELINSNVEKVRKLLESLGGVDEFGFITYLLSRKELSDQDIIIILLSLFSDGLSTTAPTLIGQLYCLATHSEVQERLRSQINTHLPAATDTTGADHTITSEVLNKLTYLKACVKEGFRIFPVGTETSRITQIPLVIGGYHIPAQSHVELNQYVLLKSGEYFPEPDQYQPERWLRRAAADAAGGTTGTSTHPFLLTPFGHGPRMCAGRRFAEQDIYVFICKLLQKYRISYKYGEMKQKYKLLLVPSNTAQFTLTPLTTEQ